MSVEKNPHDPSAMTAKVMHMDMMSNVENPDTEVELNDDGSITVDLDPMNGPTDASLKGVDGEDFYENLAEKIDEEELFEISRQVIESYEADKESRAEWESMFEKGFELLGLKLEDTTEPFAGAATAVHPLLIESAVKFQSKASTELLPANGPVKTKIIGEQTPELSDQANRIKNFMNYQITEEMEEYFDEAERMLFHLPLMGSAIKKLYWDTSLDRPVSEFVPLDQFYVSNFASNLNKADRYTQVIYSSPIDMERDVHTGMYRDVELMEADLPELGGLATKMNKVTGMTPSAQFDMQYVLLEQHCYLEIEMDEDEAGYEHLPYIVTVEEKSGEVLAIRRNYDKDDPLRKKKQFYTHYKFVPGFGFFGLGLIHFLGNLTMSATSAMRSLLDAGQFATLPAGFKAKGVRISGDNDPIAPGEFKEVEATGMDLSKSIVPLPYKEPSQTLFQMLQFVAQAGQQFADSTEQVVNDNAAYGPVGTTMALLEAGGKFFSAIHKRLHQAQKQELKILARLNYENLPESYPYALPEDQQRALKSDFDGRIDVIPVSDPNIPSNAHRMMMAQMALDMAGKSPPGMYNTEELHRTVLQSANMPNLERILPAKKEPKPMDPVSDIVAATKGAPIKAFAGQDHQSHIAVKMAYLQDPINGANPIMQRISPILSANMQEHSVLAYQEQMNGMMRASAEQGLVEQNPAAMAQAMQQAAQQVLQANQAKAGGNMPPEQQMVEIDKQRLVLENRRVDMTAAKENAEAILKNRELDLKAKELEYRAYKDGAAAVVKQSEGDRNRENKKVIEAVKLITDIIKHDDKMSSSDIQQTKSLLDKLITKKGLSTNENT